jgi:hypothetical protein
VRMGPGAVAALAPADVAIVIDVFSFTTCVDVTTSRGAAILPYPWKDALASDFERSQGAELAGRRGSPSTRSLQSLTSKRPRAFIQVQSGFEPNLASGMERTATTMEAAVTSALLTH